MEDRSYVDKEKKKTRRTGRQHKVHFVTGTHYVRELQKVRQNI